MSVVQDSRGARPGPAASPFVPHVFPFPASRCPRPASRLPVLVSDHGRSASHGGRPCPTRADRARGPQPSGAGRNGGGAVGLNGAWVPGRAARSPRFDDEAVDQTGRRQPPFAGAFRLVRTRSTYCAKPIEAVSGRWYMTVNDASSARSRSRPLRQPDHLPLTRPPSAPRARWRFPTRRCVILLDRHGSKGRRLTVSTRMPRLAVEALAATGADVAALLESLGIERSHLDDVDGRLPVTVDLAVWAGARRLSGDECFGLHAAERVRPGAFDVLGYTLHSSATLGGAFERLVRYNHLLHDLADLRLTLNGGEARQPPAPAGRNACQQGDFARGLPVVQPPGDGHERRPARGRVLPCRAREPPSTAGSPVSNNFARPAPPWFCRGRR